MHWGEYDHTSWDAFLEDAEWFSELFGINKAYQLCTLALYVKYTRARFKVRYSDLENVLDPRGYIEFEAYNNRTRAYELPSIGEGIIPRPIKLLSRKARSETKNTKISDTMSFVKIIKRVLGDDFIL